MTEPVTRELDARDLRCPEPVMMLHAEVRKIRVGDLLSVIATDPSTERDIPKFCSFLGHELLVHEARENGEFHYLIRKGR